MLGKMAGDGEGPHGVAVQGAVDAVEDFCHGQSIDQGGSNDNGKIDSGEGATGQWNPGPLSQTHSPNPLYFFLFRHRGQGKGIIL